VTVGEQCPIRTIYLVSQQFHIDAVAQAGPAFDICLVVTRPRLLDAARRSFPAAVAYDVNDARGAVWPGAEDLPFHGVPDDLLEEIAPYEAATLAMLDRPNWTGASVMATRQIYLRQLEIWDRLLREHEPELVLCHGEPHRGFDWILYGLCQTRHIPTAILTFTQLDDRVLIRSAIDDLPGPSPEVLQARAAGTHVDRVDVPAPKEIEVEDRGERGREVVAPPSFYVRTTIARERDTTALRRRLAPGRSLLRRGVLGRVRQLFDPYPATFPNVVPDAPVSFRARQVANARLRGVIRRAMAIYEAAAKAPALDRPFVYFPLHFQPEATTLPMGGHLYDQLNNLRLLQAALPDGWRIVVKEHPQMLKFDKEWARARGTVFYETLRDLADVDLAPIDFPSTQLSEAARLVATTTGTAGWEAILKGRHALVFGFPWYGSCPGVHRVGSVDACRQAIADASAAGFATDSALVQAWVDEFTAACTISGSWDDEAAEHSSLGRDELLRRMGSELAAWAGSHAVGVAP
jgi:Capsule polysaccharide biosynthesis protein